MSEEFLKKNGLIKYTLSILIFCNFNLFITTPDKTGNDINASPS